MDKSLLIAVFVPTTNERGEDFKGEIGERATGYPVGKDLILTARHVLHPEPPNQRDSRYKVAIRWHYFRSGDDADWIEIADDDIVWEGQGGLDAALIRCRRPPDAVGWGPVSHERPRDGMPWVSEGFPRAAKYGNRRNPSSFIGKVCSKAPTEPYFELTVDAAPEDEEGWKGVSGMPVFVGRKILGVVKSVPPNFKAGKLYATPTWKLLEDEDFRRKIGCDDQAVRIKNIKNKLLNNMLGKSPDVVNALIEQLGISDDMVGLNDGQRADHLAERLLETDIRVVIHTLRAAHRSLCEDDGDTSQQNATAAAILVKAAQLIVPALYDYATVKWVGSQRGGGHAALVPLPACIKTVAEIIMAGVDGREAKFRPREHEVEPPEGELSLPHPPECGIASSDDKIGIASRDDKTRTAAHAHLSKKFCLEEGAKKFRRMIDDGLFALYKPSPGEPEIKLAEQRVGATAKQLRRMQEDDNMTFYMVFYLPDDEAERNALLTVIQSLKEDYKEAILFLGLNPDFEQREQEKDLFYPFYRMLPVKGHRSAP